MSKQTPNPSVNTDWLDKAAPARQLSGSIPIEILPSITGSHEMKELHLSWEP